MLRAEGAAATRDYGPVVGVWRRRPRRLDRHRRLARLATTDGYILVGDDDRGVVDTPAGGEYGVVRADVGYRAGPAFAARLGGDLFDENRQNGTPLQTNNTDLSQLRAAIEGQAGRHALARERPGRGSDIPSGVLVDRRRSHE